MNLEPLASVNECPAPDQKAFSTLQAELAIRGIELHQITGAFGREAFSVNVRGQLRTLDTLPQVMAYTKCIGVVLP